MHTLKLTWPLHVSMGWVHEEEETRLTLLENFLCDDFLRQHRDELTIYSEFRYPENQIFDYLIFLDFFVSMSYELAMKFTLIYGTDWDWENE